MLDLVIRNARLRDYNHPMDIGIRGERIAEISERVEGDTSAELNANSSLVVPGLINAHMHLDKCMIGDVMRPNESQTLQEAIYITWDHKRTYTADGIADRAGQVMESAIINGTTAMRGFADVDSVGGLTPVEGLLELKRRWSDMIHLEVVAFPQEGIMRDPGCDDLMVEAMALGADVVGGLPWYELSDDAMKEHIDFCLELAARTDKDVHMLADDTDDPYSRSLEYLALKTIETNYQGRVTASHCGALAAYDHTHADRVMDLVAQAQVSIASNAHISMVMDGRNDRGLIRRGITRVKELLDRGVNVVTAQDDVHDPYYPFGKPDQLEVAQYMSHVAQLTYPSELETVFDMVTVNAAKAMRLSDYGISVGNWADLVVLGATSVHEALRLLPPRRAVFRRGRLVAESKLDAKLHRP